jgi:hypothetical protein
MPRFFIRGRVETPSLYKVNNTVTLPPLAKFKLFQPYSAVELFDVALPVAALDDGLKNWTWRVLGDA